ncbi:MAG: DUF3853 family protein [Bacteroidales bacterium]|nr:DUF3853 family protein [Bacteroidales bacterium]
MDKNHSKMLNSSELLMIFALVWAGGLSLTEEQVSAITRTLLSSMAPIGLIPPSTQIPSKEQVETVRGMSELAQLLGVSIPTACKLSKSGKFDSARLDFGTRKFVWDRAKLLEIAKHK